ANDAGDALVGPAARGLDLPKARGVDVERFDGDVGLGLEAPGGVVVEAPRGLGKGALGLEDAVGAERIAEHVRGEGYPAPRGGCQPNRAVAPLEMARSCLREPTCGRAGQAFP